MPNGPNRNITEKRARKLAFSGVVAIASISGLAVLVFLSQLFAM